MMLSRELVDQILEDVGMPALTPRVSHRYYVGIEVPTIEWYSKFQAWYRERDVAFSMIELPDIFYQRYAYIACFDHYAHVLEFSMTFSVTQDN